MDVQQNASGGPVFAPDLPRSLTEPRLVVLAGTALFAISLVVTLFARTTFGDAWIVCACGIGVGVFGAGVLTLQRRAAQRGDRGAQQGLV